jgi:hypothetical protein
MDRRIER